MDALCKKCTWDEEIQINGQLKIEICENVYKVDSKMKTVAM